MVVANTHTGENDAWEMVNARTPGAAEEAAARQASRRRWSSSFKWLTRSYSQVPMHQYRDSISKVHDGSLIHKLDSAFESPVTLAGLRLVSSGCEPAPSGNDTSPARRNASTLVTEQDVDEDDYDDQVFYDAQLSLCTEEKNQRLCWRL